MKDTLKRFMAALPFYAKLQGVFLLLAMASLSIFRLVFYFKHSFRLKDAPAREILLAFFLGLRFDIMTVSILFGPFLVLAFAHYPNRLRAYRFFWVYGPIILLTYMIAILIVDMIYFENANKHIGYEAYAFLGPDLFVMIGAASKKNPLLVILGLGGLVAFGFMVSRTMRRFPYSHPDYDWKRVTLHLALIIGALIVGIRGGAQVSPIRSSDAIISSNPNVNALVVSGAYTALMDLKVTGITRKHRMDVKEAVAIVRSQIAYEGAEFVSEEYPLLRKIPQSNSGKPPNIMFIVLEGWSGRFINPITDGKVNGKLVAPHFNRRLKEGLFFKRMFASGGRTTNGLMALMGGIPDRPGLTAVRTQQILNPFSGLGNILGKMGYATIFVAGNDLSFNNKRKIMSHWGFENLTGKTRIEKMGKYKIGAWGYNDRDILDVAHNEILKLPADKPFVAVVHTITTHHPYKTPHKKFDIFDESVQDHEYLNCYHYADWSVNDFLEQAKRSRYFKNTIFVLASDHSHHRYLNYYEDRNVPLLLWAPGRIKPGIREDIVSQLDVLPTILQLVGKETYFSSMGRSLLAREGGNAYFAYGNVFGWVENEMFFFSSVEGGSGEAFTVNPPHRDTRACHINRADCDAHYAKARAFLNLTYFMLNRNKIFPSPAELAKLP